MNKGIIMKERVLIKRIEEELAAEQVLRCEDNPSTIEISMRLSGLSSEELQIELGARSKAEPVPHRFVRETGYTHPVSEV